MHVKTDYPVISDILFDLGKVLVPFDWNIALGRLVRYLTPHHLSLVKKDREAFKSLFHEPSAALERGEIDFARFHTTVMDILDTRIPAKEFRRIWCDIFTLNRQMVELGRTLSDRYGTWLVSNTSRAHYDWILAKFPEIAFYKGAALSFELGVMKPAEEYYEKIIEKFGLDPTRCVFIDDLPENVEAAVQAGMWGIIFTGREQLVERLRELGIALF
jgi:putative hydrolase of the HAD superfamily